MDDVLVHGKTELKVQEYTQEVISITQNTGFKANCDKTQLVQSEVKYSETVLGQEGRVMLGSPMGRTDYESPCPTAIIVLDSHLELLKFFLEYPYICRNQ